MPCCLQVLGVVENMSTLQVSLPSLRFINTKQPAGSQQADLTAAVTAALQQALVQTGLVQDLSNVTAAAEVFLPSGGGAANMCKQLQLQLLGRVPLDPLLGQAAEEGRSVLDKSQTAAGEKTLAPSAAALQAIVQQLITAIEAYPEAANGSTA